MNVPTPEIVTLRRIWRKHPPLFCRQVLGWEPTPWQAAILQMVADHPGEHAIGTGHGVGKTSRIAAPLVLWGLACFDPCTVVGTAPTGRQAQKMLWANVAAQYQGARIPIGGELLGTELRISPSRFALCFSTKKSERFQGFHPVMARSEDADRPMVMVIEDEASGIPEAIDEAIDGSTTGPDDRIVRLGNPLNPQSAHGMALLGKRPGVHKMTVSSWDAARYGEAHRIPGMVSTAWCEKMRKKHGERSPTYLARVLGLVPPESADALIQMAWIERAFNTDPAPMEGGSTTVIGLDVARFGTNRTVWVVRHQRDILHIEDAMGIDTTEITTRTLVLARRFRSTHVAVDDTGVGGGVTDQLRAAQRERHTSPEVIAVNFGETAINEEEFADRRSELWWTMREWLHEGEGACPRHDELEQDWLAPKYRYTAKGQRLELESKKNMVKRLNRSPDYGDAAALSLVDVDDVAVTTSVHHKPWRPHIRIPRMGLPRMDRNIL